MLIHRNRKNFQIKVFQIFLIFKVYVEYDSRHDHPREWLKLYGGMYKVFLVEYNLVLCRRNVKLVDGKESSEKESDEKESEEKESEEEESEEKTWPALVSHFKTYYRFNELFFDHDDVIKKEVYSSF